MGSWHLIFFILKIQRNETPRKNYNYEFDKLGAYQINFTKYKSRDNQNISKRKEKNNY